MKRNHDFTEEEAAWLAENFGGKVMRRADREAFGKRFNKPTVTREAISDFRRDGGMATVGHSPFSSHQAGWESRNGPLPEGMTLVSKDGDRWNLEPSNWVAIPKGAYCRLHELQKKFGQVPNSRPTLIAIACLRYRLAELKRGQRRPMKSQPEKSNDPKD